ncbi:MAG: DJ-1/PfpI family protein [Patescibacteria group bacterium]|nr:DJ-1/PfpI family protein [Patescibacteria group bacterium]
MKKLGILILLIIAAIGLIFVYISRNKASEEETSQGANTSQESQNDEENSPIDLIDHNPQKNILLVLAFQDFNDQEYINVKNTLRSNKFDVITASTETGSATGMKGTRVRIDLSIDEISTDDFLGVVFVGGSGAHIYFDNETVQNLARSFYDAGKLTSAICSGPVILANAGLLQDKKATCYPGYEENLTSKGATHTGDNVTVDGNIVTGKGPDEAREFAEKVVEMLSKEN